MGILLETNLWKGQHLKCDGAFGFDTETTMIEPGQIPELIVLTFSDNKRSYIVSPDMVGAWVEMIYLSGCNIVAHNVAFDYHVVFAALKYVEEVQMWKAMVEQNKVWDTMILDFLVRLANGEEDGPLRPKSLSDLSEHYLSVKLDKTLQTEWSKFLGQPMENIPDEYFAYALKDSAVTRELFNELHPVAVHISNHNNCLIELHGPLTHHTQVKGSIALTDCSRVGIKVDTEAQQNIGVEIKLQINDIVNWLDKNYPALFKRDVRKKFAGKLMYNYTTGVPSIDSKALRIYLLNIATELKLKDKSIPKTDKSGEITTSAEYWSEYSHPFIQNWQDMITKAKLLNFVEQIKTERVNPRYQALVRTGRTSCSKPNLQQMPKAQWFRKLFVPSKGTKFIIADYNAVELRCLGAICKTRLGFSQLAKTFYEGIDPHAYTASSLSNIPFAEFMSLKKSDPEKFKRFRQSAKAVNFGVPGGLGAKSLMEYASASYGVQMTLDEAKEWKNKLVTEVYPELTRYLFQDVLGALCFNLQCGADEVCDAFNLRSAGVYAFSPIQDVVSGNLRNRKGTGYTGAFRRHVWNALLKINKDSSLEMPLRSQRGSPSLRRRIFGNTVVTLTGRVRGAAEYTESCNTQFQGLASDGAKLALYAVSQLYPVVAFVHDELVVEVPADEPEKHGRVIESLMNTSMDKVLGGFVRSEVEWVVSDTWSKT